MIDQPENLMLVYMRRFDEKLDRVVDDVRDIKTRLTTVEEKLAQIDFAIAGVNRRIDRIEVRLEKIERRLEIVDVPH